MSSGSRTLRSSAAPVLNWAHQNLEGPNPERTPKEAAEAVDTCGQPRNLRPGKPRTPPRGDGGGPHRTNVRRVKKKEKLRISLTEEEIREDLYSMTGKIATVRTSKRTQIVQKALDKLFPGLRLDGTSSS